MLGYSRLHASPAKKICPLTSARSSSMSLGVDPTAK
eukprot:CAMPEP_0171604166 /NCGR_PEP_ID=MMETSP0990-20121206/6450_1 /TAXON_ID=483369 /ORGANISM="non described non described, Strain CCMP2098" /LENGTH=35 /DNA_ID= /DNA_START= /DNA_END= /DNA_ORIENTATION=